MSENLDLVRSIYAAWGRGDYSSTEWAHPEIEFVMIGGPEPVTASGVTGMAKAWRSWLAPWEEFHAEAEEYREIDDERVLVLVKNTGRGKTSGLNLGQMHPRVASLFHIHGGKVTKLLNYLEPYRALADLGLAPEGGSGEPGT
jgi:ketosteroid isomerase-like protein